jgi:hypothetical protein
MHQVGFIYNILERYYPSAVHSVSVCIIDILIFEEAKYFFINQDADFPKLEKQL